MHPVFFYGLFMNPEFIREQAYHPDDVRLSYVKNYRIWIGNKASMTPRNGHRVYGTLMTMSNTELNALYNQPGVLEYVPVEVDAHLLNEYSTNVIQAKTYILPIDTVNDSDAQFNQHYARKLCDTAHQLNLPQEYIAELTSLLNNYPL